MKQLTGIDASFLYMETPSTFGHVTGLMIFERPSPDFEPYAAAYAKYASLVGVLEPMRRRVVEVPFGLDHPYWIADPNFDLDFHVRELNIAKPGRVDQLAEQVSRIHGRPMDRSRPLWEVYVIDGLESGRWALLTKYHHATIDGASGQLMLEIITDTEPDAAAAGREPTVGARADPERRRAAPPGDRQPGPQPAASDAGAGPHRARSSPTPPGSPASAVSRRKPVTRSSASPSAGPAIGRECSLPTTAGAADAVEQDDHPAPPLRHAHRRRWRTSSASRRPPAGRSTTSSWRSAPAGCASTCCATTRCRTARCGRWCRCRSAPATSPIRGRTGCRPSSPTCRPTAPTRSNGSPAAARR